MQGDLIRPRCLAEANLSKSRPQHGELYGACSLDRSVGIDGDSLARVELAGVDGDLAMVLADELMQLTLQRRLRCS
jgi:hypothetical protein